MQHLERERKTAQKNNTQITNKKAYNIREKYKYIKNGIFYYKMSNINENIFY